jgi:hypothetical protein
VVNKVVTGVVRRSTVDTMDRAGWIEYNGNRGSYEISRAGRAHVEVKTFVRAFSEGA